MSTLVDPCACRYDQHRGLFGNCPLACAYHVTLCFHAGRYLPLSNVWSTVVAEGGETRTAHIKQCVSKRKEVNNGANPLHSPSLKTKKAIYNCVRSEPCLISLPRKHQVKRNACVNGLNHCLRQQRLNYKHIFSGCVKQYQKYFQSVCKMKIAAGLGHLFKQKMLRRVRRKRLNTAAGFVCCRCKNGLNFTHHNLQLLVLSSLRL